MQLKFKKYLVLGSNSFTGSNFINHILNKKIQIIGISRSKEYPTCMLSYKTNKNFQNFKFYRLDLNKDLKKIIDLIEHFKPNVILNFAAQGEVRNSWLYPEDWFKTNCNSVVNLTSKLIDKKYLKKYISISTPEVYGNTNKKIKENNFFNPSTPYAASKLAGDLHLITLHKKYNFPVSFSRSSNVYGPHQQLYRIIPRSIIFLKKNKIIDLHDRGKSKRSFIHVKDVCDALNKIITKGKNGKIYHISNDKIFSIKDIVKLICLKMNKNYNNYINLIDENFGQDSIYKLNSNKIRKELNWKEQHSIHQGINETINWINDNWNVISKMSYYYKHKI